VPTISSNLGIAFPLQTEGMARSAFGRMVVRRSSSEPEQTLPNFVGSPQ
jgi:hypothetical protein